MNEYKIEAKYTITVRADKRRDALSKAYYKVRYNEENRLDCYSSEDIGDFHVVKVKYDVDLSELFERVQSQFESSSRGSDVHETVRVLAGLKT